jgi:hypothetical protein
MVELDLRNAITPFGTQGLLLTFTGERSRVSLRNLPGRWWLYEEGHPASDGHFALHVMFDRGDVEIVAADLSIRPTRRAARG